MITMENEPLTYRGVDARWRHRTGRTTRYPEAAALVTELYDRGWRSLTVFRAGLEVGGIAHPATRRVWWGEREEDEE